jgi:NADH:ubiquinone oxidoreductase subunit C
VSTGENLLERVQASLGEQALETGMAHGILVLQIDPASLVPVVKRLRHELGFDLFLDVTAAPTALRRRLPLLFHPRLRPGAAQDAG